MYEKLSQSPGHHCLRETEIAELRKSVEALQRWQDAQHSSLNKLYESLEGKEGIRVMMYHIRDEALRGRPTYAVTAVLTVMGSVIGAMGGYFLAHLFGGT